MLYIRLDRVCIANHLKSVLPALINKDKTGFMPNRSIGDTIRLIYDLIACLNTNNKLGLLLCLDFEKSFDSVDWKFMHKVLQAFGLMPVSGLSFYITTSVSANHQLSHWFKIQRGCRQGL